MVAWYTRKLSLCLLGAGCIVCVVALYQGTKLTLPIAHDGSNLLAIMVALSAYLAAVKLALIGRLGSAPRPPRPGRQKALIVAMVPADVCLVTAGIALALLLAGIGKPETNHLIAVLFVFALGYLGLLHLCGWILSIVYWWQDTSGRGATLHWDGELHSRNEKPKVATVANMVAKRFGWTAREHATHIEITFGAGSAATLALENATLVPGSATLADAQTYDGLLYLFEEIKPYFGRLSVSGARDLIRKPAG